MSSSNCFLLNKSGWQKAILQKIETELGCFSRILENDNVKIDIGQQMMLFFFFFFTCFFMLGRVRGKTDTLCLESQSIQTRVIFSQKFCKMRTESAGDRCSSINAILETYQYPFVKLCSLRVSLSSQARSLLPRCVDLYLVVSSEQMASSFPHNPASLSPFIFPSSPSSPPPLFLSPSLNFLKFGILVQDFIFIFGPKMLYERIKILI